MRKKSQLDFLSLGLSALLTVAVALAVAGWYGFGRVMVKPFALPLFIFMFAAAVGMPAYGILLYVRRRHETR